MFLLKVSSRPILSYLIWLSHGPERKLDNKKISIKEIVQPSLIMSLFDSSCESLTENYFSMNDFV